MEKEEKQNINLNEHLQGGLERIAAEHTEALEELKMLQIFASGLLSLEAMQVREEAGAGDAQVQALEAQAAHCRELVQGIEVELERAHIRPPTVGEEDALVHGRVVDEDHRGLSGLTVAGEDEKSSPMNRVGMASTDMNGYYALTIPAKVAEKLSQKEQEVFLVVRGGTAKLLYRAKEGLLIKPGARFSLEIMISAATVVGYHPRSSEAEQAT